MCIFTYCRKLLKQEEDINLTIFAEFLTLFPVFDRFCKPKNHDGYNKKFMSCNNSI